MRASGHAPARPAGGDRDRAPLAGAQAIVERVARAYALTPEKLLSGDRHALLVEARRVAMQLLRERGMDVVTIGRVIGRDHSTVLHHLGLIQHSPTPDERAMLALLRHPSP